MISMPDDTRCTPPLLDATTRKRLSTLATLAIMGALSILAGVGLLADWGVSW